MLEASLFLFDIHGVFITRELDREPKVLGGHRLIEALRNKGKRVAVVGSASHLTTRDVWRMLRDLGFNFELDEVWPASRIAAEHLREIFGSANCLVVGARGLVEELESRGHRVVDDWRDADAVVVGYDRDLSFEKLTKALRAINNRDAYFLAVSKVRWYYLPDEGPLLSPGAIVAALEYQTGREAIVVGKPSLVHYVKVLDYFGVKARDAVMVGDDVEADIIPAKTLGMHTVLVSTVNRWEKINVPRRLVDVNVNHVDELVEYI